MQTGTFNQICREIYQVFKKYDVEYPTVKVRYMISRWGSCQPKRGVITLNSKLIEAPRNCIEYDILGEINEMIIDYNTPDDPTPGGSLGDDKQSDEPENKGTLILDATCAPQNIAYPQDIKILNEARENLEDMIDYLCATNDKPTPRMYRKNARRDYLNLAKSKKRTVKRIRKAIKQQLQYIRRDRGYINNSTFPA